MREVQDNGKIARNLHFKEESGGGQLKDHYVDLDRRFDTFSSDTNTEAAAMRSYLAAMHGDESNASWIDILKHRLVVVLGEPGSGKSEEFRRQAEVHRGNGRAVFLLELNRLVTDDFADVLGEARFADFGRWKSGQTEAVFFLDAVDESKLLRVDDFLIALDRVHGVTSQYLHRSRFVISSRISAWRPETDRAEVLRRFGLTISPPGKDSNEQSKQPISIVTLSPLNRQRVEIFARERGICDPAAFVAAVDQHDAWDFARRPLDVIELHRYWQENGRLGSLTELMAFSCHHLIKEVERREQHDPLPIERVEEGVETLAAASLLTRQLNIRIDDDRDVAAASAVVIRDVLPASWPNQQQKAVLNRALFDGASYGMLRFHHRRHAEFLAAKWLARLLANNCPYTEIEEVLFAEVYGRWAIRPSLEPVAAWLAGMGDVPSIGRLRQRLLKIAPDIHLRYGDPAALPLDYRKSVLKELVDRYKGRNRVSITWDGDALKRLASPELSADMSAYLGSTETPEDLKCDLLMLVAHGRLSDCCAVAITMFCDTTVSESLRLYAATAIREAGTPAIRRQAYGELIAMPNPTSRLVGSIVEATFPAIISVDELFAALRKAPEIRRNSVDLPYTLRKHLDGVLTPDAALIVLQGALHLLREPPLIEKRSVSKRYAWTVELLPRCLRLLLNEKSISHEAVGLIVDAVGVLESRNLHGWWDKPIRGNDEKQLLADLDRHADVKRAIYWRRVNRHRERYAQEPAIHSLQGSYDIAKFSPSDIYWMKHEVVAGKLSMADRQLILGHMVVEARHAGGFWLFCSKDLLPVVGFELRVWRFVISQFSASVWWPIKGWALRQKHNGVGDKYWWKNKARVLNAELIFLKDWYWIWRHHASLRQGNHAYTLARIVMESGRLKTSREEVDWGAVANKWGRSIGRTIRVGCEAIWRRYSPVFPHEKTDGNVEYFVIAGLPGLDSLWQQGTLDFVAMTGDEVVLATRYACRELNGFPDWLPQLLAQRPSEAGGALMQAIAGEWEYPTDQQHVHGVLSTLVWNDIDTQAVLPVVVQFLMKGDPKNQQMLAHALDLIMKNAAGRAMVAVMAPARELVSTPGTAPWFLWVGAWLRVDGVAAVHAIEQRLAGLALDAADALVVGVCSNLLDRRGGNTSGAAPTPSFREVACLSRLIPLVNKHVRPDGDRDHSNGEAYSPTARDDAARFRYLLWELLRDSESLAADGVLRDFLNDPSMTRDHDWILELLDRRRSRRADDVPWKSVDVRNFADKHLIAPRSDDTLYRLICRHLRNIQGCYERSEVPDARNRLRDGDLEVCLRNLLHDELKKCAGDWYSVTAESEVDLEQRPDITINRPGLNSLPIEVKLANLSHWPLHKLLERLENQLVGQYLRAENVRYGLYVLGNTDPNRRWEDIGSAAMIDFHTVVQRVTARAKSLEKEYRPGVDGITVIGIDFSDPRKRK